MGIPKADLAEARGALERKSAENLSLLRELDVRINGEVRR
jgi:hypothetical protein